MCIQTQICKVELTNVKHKQNKNIFYLFIQTKEFIYSEMKIRHVRKYVNSFS